MTIFQVAYKNIVHQFSSSFLGALLSALGTTIFCLILLLSFQLNEQLTLNSKHIDLVIGAKGSPLQLILNSIYHVDYPTGNIPLEEALALTKSPLVKIAVPLSMGDNYQGYRIIGTDSSFFKLYGTTVAQGKWWSTDFEAVVGAEVAKEKHIRVGDKLVGAHGLTSSTDLHADHPYTVVGILEKNNSVADKLVLTDLSSVWHMHEEHHHHHEDESALSHDDDHDIHDLIALGNHGKEITSMLIQYKNPTAVAMFPRMVNQTTGMQAASPALESARLFSILGIGLDALKFLAVTLMLIAAISVFISLYNAFKSRKYELAIMRTMGAARLTLFGIMVIEGIYITVFGALAGIVLAHFIMYVISQVDNTEFITAWQFVKQEIWIVVAAVLLGFIAALLPAIKAYFTQISKILAEE
ncbi:hypothetical protein GCM10023231_13540 [Olivibacter ginsenosidimutans]|uniref:FtsX-like permease family protein n=1 Tax=Olivibacter ginsenosidimutans TaxID=1176537 RepID=A0ABP9AYI3_9SPHI